jgi:hypothetical protein
VRLRPLVLPSHFTLAWIYLATSALKSRGLMTQRHRLTIKIFGLLGAVAEGPIAIGALLLIVLLLTAWWR